MGYLKFFFPEGLYRYLPSLAAAFSLCGLQNVYAQGSCDPNTLGLGSLSGTVCNLNEAKVTAAKTNIKGVLLFDWTKGGHDPVHTQKHMIRLSQKYGFRLDRSNSRTYISTNSLKDIDIVVFNNGDGDPFDNNSTQLTAIRDFIEKQGKSALVIHAGGAYLTCPNEDMTNSNCTWFARGLRTWFWIHNGDPTKATIFADSVKTGEIPPRATGTSAVGAKQNHGRMNDETRMIFQDLPNNGGNGALANREYVWEGLGDEWYNYRNNPRLEGERTLDGVKYGAINILLSLDESSVASNASCNGGSNACKNQGTYGDRPVSWTRKVGAGIFAYQNAAHSNVYTRTRTVGTANVNDSIIEHYNWRLMRYLAHDFVGCTDPTDKAYNPEASVKTLTTIDPANPCLGPVTSRLLGKSGTVNSGLRIGTAKGQIQFELQGQEKFEIMVADAAGKSHYARSLQGPSKVIVPDLKAGAYYVRWSHASESKIESITVP